MAMKNVNLGLFFMWNDEADNLLEAQQAGEEDGSAIDGKRDGEPNHPIDIQLFDKQSYHNNRGKENKNVKPITPIDFQLQDAFGEQVLQEGGYGLHAKAGAGRSHRLESRYDDEIQQDIDDYARSCHEVELLQTAVGREQCAENVCC